MKVTLTDKQFEAAMAAFERQLYKPGYDSAVRAALESIELPDTLPTLRPIAEMPEVIPAECRRLYMRFYPHGGFDLPKFDPKECTHALDIARHPSLPAAPVDANRSSFESALKQSGFHDFRRDGDGYVAAYANAAWNGWKLCNETKKGAQP